MGGVRIAGVVVALIVGLIVAFSRKGDDGKVVLKDAKQMIRQVQGFHESPEYYERLVDRLLASPHCGERWGRHWLDAARYADSNGYTIDSCRSIWGYRDWVIDALNADMPFDRFTIEQIAGDMLPNATQDQRIATGFHRNTLVNEEGGTDKEQFRVEAVVDRVSTVGTVWLGLTVACARCHDHKYDPIAGARCARTGVRDHELNRTP